MLRLEDVLYAEGSGQENAWKLSRKYGADPLKILVEIETKMEIKANLNILLKELNEVQREILMMTGLGYTTRAIAVELNRSQSTIIGCRQKIGRKLQEVGDEKRIERLARQLKKWQGKKKTGQSYSKVKEEYQRRSKVREALKNLLAALTTIEVQSIQPPPPARPTLLFERISKVGRKRDCGLKRYLETAFGDAKTACTLCKKCREK